MNFHWYCLPSEALVPGYIGRHCSFEFKEFKDRSDADQDKMMDLLGDLLAKGVKQPLITYKCKYILIGMRRFDLLKNVKEDWWCLDIDLTEDIDHWKAPDIKQFKAWVKEMYGEMYEQNTSG